ncbi:hypothetical protein [Zavarzinella formosa]|uniref:hypothetical protein n=1 Tax=Zavarzinella formosa TaxID=360055 RepID=UPI0012FB308C|nr:hypothetical protein [Zavarzinella formosa]
MIHFLRVLICLACGPLLLPSSFCVCAEDGRESALIGHEDHHDHDCPGEHSPHDVDCPTMWEALVSPVISMDLIPVFAWLMPPAMGDPRPVAVVSPLESASLSKHVDPPLYLSHCALVI